MDGSTIAEGDVLIGLPSTGVHSNGFSLVRKALFEKAGYTVDTVLDELDGEKLGDVLLTPTKIYVKALSPLFKAGVVKGVAHITGGGFIENVPRMIPDGLAAHINLGSWPVLPIFDVLEKAGEVDHMEMFNIFNMGIGMVLAVNAEHGILIVEQTGEDTLGMEYAGKIALCKKPENIYVARARLGDYGSFVSDMVRDYDAILGINASGFADFDGNGTGGTVYGFLKSRGEKYQDAVGDGWKIIGFDNEDHLQVGAFNDTSSLRDAVEFHPALIINGENLVAGTGLNEQQPRTAIGQAKDGTVIMMVIDGRQMHSFGISIERCGEIMEQYGAYQASMLDGGSSSVMVYKGREITSPTTLSQNEEGRTLPDAFLIK